MQTLHAEAIATETDIVEIADSAAEVVDVGDPVEAVKVALFQPDVERKTLENSVMRGSVVAGHGLREDLAEPFQRDDRLLARIVAETPHERNVPRRRRQ